MGFLDEMKRISRPYGDTDDEFDEDYETPERRRPLFSQRTASASAKTSDFDEVLNDLGASKAPRRPVAVDSGRVVNINATAQMQVVLVKPDQFKNVSDIADHLRNKHAVVLNLENANKDISRRLVDFLSGCAYALEGQIKKIAVSTYLITPINVSFVGDQLMDELENSGLYL